MNYIHMISAKLRQPGIKGVVRAFGVAIVVLIGVFGSAHYIAKAKGLPTASLDSQCAAKAGVMLSGHCVRQSALIQLKR